MKPIIYFLKQIHNYSGKIVYINLFAMAGIGLLDGVAILLLVPLISMSGIVDMGVEGVPILSMFDFMEDIPANIGLPIILAIFVMIVIGQNIVKNKLNLKNTMIQLGFLHSMRLETYKLLLYADWQFFVRNRKSDFINILSSEIGRSSVGAYSVLQFISSLTITIIQIGLAFVISSTVTTFVLLCGLVLIFFNRKFLKRSLALGNRNFELGKEYISGITDHMNGIKDIKSNTLEKSRLDWYVWITKGIEKEQVDYTRLKLTSQLYYKVASAVLIAIFIYFAVMMFNAQAAQLMLIIVVFSRLWPRVAGLQSSMEQIATTIPSFRAVIAMQEECRNSQEFDAEANTDITPLTINQGIQCTQVYFRYNQTASYALKNINVTIPTNQMTAFVGRSGAGKSTLIDILMGLNKAEKGQVLIDGVALSSDNLVALRRSISYVPQEPFLFNTSIRDNLSIVKADATEEEMWEALDFSSAAEFVNKLTDGLDTIIGDRGIKLSGGERQRLVLARAILRKPSILVLDEATSSLDTENEAKIQQALERLKGKMTIIVIAHRLSTIRNADQVVVLEDGEIIQKGGFTQLSKEKKSVFSNLLHNQLEAIK
ncbi:multidrug ABC transporter [Virgibacillus profundi]|uniref:Multidrug ABC transporter n=1 Tax=Virgibacillus profundi TaxID=2024555 RepID=A0A2A2IJT4_9BACI|nr:ABC transporter ATP-binding protein [Virgibacillus profundi]PAV31524.1 multidrug ABC transporter [Virgibacillus profundi]PXY55710.1 ABC transporter ATP-binding protein [Virgibacillus profundi]